MYIPTINEWKNNAEVLSFLKRYSFATIINNDREGHPHATHLPFVVEQNGDALVLKSHFAKANPQWNFVTQGMCLVIFMEPHAYISPSHYDKEQSVPTWNYQAVHAYGTAQIIDEPAHAFSLLEQTIQTYEADYQKQWEGLPAAYKEAMLKGIVAFEMQVTHLQTKAKLSQNKTETEQKRIAKTLLQTEDSVVNALGKAMENYQKEAFK